MSFCYFCKRKRCLKSGKPCKKVERQLPKPGSGRMFREISFSSQVIDKHHYKDWDGDIYHCKPKKKISHED